MPLSKLTSLAHGIADILFPPICSVCGDRLRLEDQTVCKPCRASFNEIGRTVCRICGHPQSRPTKNRCPECPAPPVHFDSVRAAFYYAGGKFSETFIAFKYRQSHELGRVLGRAMFMAFLRLENPGMFASMADVPNIKDLPDLSLIPSPADSAGPDDQTDGPTAPPPPGAHADQADQTDQADQAAAVAPDDPAHDPETAGAPAEDTFNAQDPTGLAALVDFVTPVPLHFIRRLKRGYNQAEVLAVEFAPLANIPCVSGLVARSRRTSRQAGLPRSERRANVQGAFEVLHPDRVRDRRVGLFDDIVTSGNTVNECARALKDAGAAQVHVIALARA